jgi:hypothetical protein
MAFIYAMSDVRGHLDIFQETLVGEWEGAVWRTVRPLFVTKPLFWSCCRTERPLLSRKTLKSR